MRPIIFLDCDGVVNNYYTFRKPHPERQRLIIFLSEPDLVERLRRFCVEVDAIVVVSSTWRKGNERRQFISYLGDWLQPHIPRSGAWRTGNDRQGHRGNEVRAWREKHKRYRDHPYVIFDDDRDFHADQPFVHCDPETGLSDTAVEKARQLLRQQGFGG